MNKIIMKKKTKFKIKVFLFIVIIIFTVCFFMQHRMKMLRKNKLALISIMNDIKIGDNAVQVKNIYEKYRTEQLKLRKISRENVWMITMPLEFGASDWVLWVKFDDNKVTSLKIRFSDSKDIKPENAPSDKVIYKVR